MTFSERLAEWVDFDGAAFALGVALGLWPAGPAAFQAHKAVFWTSDPLGGALDQIREVLVLAGVLEEEAMRYRWAGAAGTASWAGGAAGATAPGSTP